MDQTYYENYLNITLLYDKGRREHSVENVQILSAAADTGTNM